MKVCSILTCVLLQRFQESRCLCHLPRWHPANPTEFYHIFLSPGRIFRCLHDRIKDTIVAISKICSHFTNNHCSVYVCLWKLVKVTQLIRKKRKQMNRKWSCDALQLLSSCRMQGNIPEAFYLLQHKYSKCNPWVTTRSTFQWVLG